MSERRLIDATALEEKAIYTSPGRRALRVTRFHSG